MSLRHYCDDFAGKKTISVKSKSRSYHYRWLAVLFLFFHLNSAQSYTIRPEMTIKKTESVPVIDGVLDEAMWKQGTLVTEFFQREPVSGVPVSESTEAWLVYDSNTIYIGVRMHDREAADIVAQELREDEKMQTDDLFVIAIDSMLDRRNAFVFYINPLGTKSDARIEDNSNFNQEWDGIWYAAASRDEKGWTAEFAIPFKTLSMNPDSEVWGLDLERYIRRRSERSYWASYNKDTDFIYVVNYGDLMGLENLTQGKGLDIKPQMASRYRRAFNSDDKDFTIKPGVEAVYKVRPSLNASLIINPDFSPSNVDDIKTNLTRFNLFFPEQRDFFIRDADIFQFGGLSETNGIPFFTRRIGLPFDRENPEPLDLDVGAKLSGRVGPYAMGLLSTQMGSGQGIASKNLSVGRFTMDVQEESRIGTMLTYGNPTSGEDNGVAGVDYHYRNSKVFGSQSFVADAFAMKSFSEDINGNEMAYGLSVEFPNDSWNGKASFREIQENFNPALGFVNRTGIRDYSGEIRRRVRPEGHSFIRTMDWTVETGFTTNTDNELQSAHVWASFFEIENHAGDQITAWGNWNHEKLNVPFEIQPGISIPVGTYDFYNAWTRLTTADHRPVAIELKSKVGQFFNGSIADVTAVVKWRPNKHFFIVLIHQVFDVNLPQGDFEFEINRALLNVNFTPTLSWSNRLQQESETHVMTLQSRVRWIIEPGSELNITLNHDWQGEGGSYKSTELDLFAHLTWTHRF
jgi:hypothetical protein